MFDTERFISAVESQPRLYDVTSKQYSNREVKAKCWLKVAEEMYVSNFLICGQINSNSSSKDDTDMR